MMKTSEEMRTAVDFDPSHLVEIEKHLIERSNELSNLEFAMICSTCYNSQADFMINFLHLNKERAISKMGELPPSEFCDVVSAYL